VQSIHGAPLRMSHDRLELLYVDTEAANERAEAQAEAGA
jgi:hypothetical protein